MYLLDIANTLLGKNTCSQCMFNPVISSEGSKANSI